MVPDNYAIGARTLEKLLCAHISIIPVEEAYENIFYRIPIHIVKEGWIIRHVQSTRQRINELLTRAFDILFASLIGLLTLPFSLLIALAVKFEDSGPIVYSHIRIGKNRRPFRLYKFRSMVENAERDGAKWSDLGAPNANLWASWTTDDANAYVVGIGELGHHQVTVTVGAGETAYVQALISNGADLLQGAVRSTSVAEASVLVPTLNRVGL